MSTPTNTPAPRCVLCCPRWAVLDPRYSFLSVSNTLLGLRFSVTRKSRSRYALQGDLTLVVRHCWRSGSTWGRTRCGATLWETSRHPLRNTNTIRAGNVWCSTTQRGTSTEILIGGRNLASIVLWSPNCHSKTVAAIFSLAAAAGWTSRTSTCLLPFSSMLNTRVTAPRAGRPRAQRPRLRGGQGVRLLRLQPEPELLAHHGGQEGAHRVRLPAGGARDSGDGGAARSA